MAKTIKKVLLAILMSTLCCLFFSMPVARNTNAASIENLSGNMFMLTGYIDYTPKHYFRDDGNNSTLYNAKAVDKGGDYYSIVDNGSGASYGWGNLHPTKDMEPFITAGILYAKLEADVTVKNTNIQFTISCGENSVQASTSSTGKISTDLLPVSELTNIKFEFMATSPSGKNDFVISNPVIYLHTKIHPSSIKLECDETVVIPEQLVKVNAYNEVTKLYSEVAGNFMSVSKKIHEIQYYFESGEEYVQRIGTNLKILSNAKDGATIRFKVGSRISSESEELVYSSNYVELKVNAKSVDVVVRTDFIENPPATIDGEGAHDLGRPFTLTVTPNKGYEFLGWYLNGQFVSNKYKYKFTAALDQDIYAKFSKKISISRVEVKSKVYDGTTAIKDEDVTVYFDGVESTHDVRLDGVKYAYFDANAGKSKTINAIFESLKLVGDQSDIYVLTSEVFPTILGTIDRRDVTIFAKSTQKFYGDSDPIFEFTTQGVINGEQISGMLGRTAGETTNAKYSLNLGNLPEKNPNYNFTLKNNGAYLEILKRRLTLDENIIVEEKIYDGTTKAQIKALLKNVCNNDDVTCSINAEFESCDAGIGIKIKIIQLILSGADKQNYYIGNYTREIYGNILPKEVEVRANACQLVYGSEIDLKYSTIGLVYGDTLDGKLQIDGVSVGKYEIKIGTLHGDNYKIKFSGAICEITPKPLTVQVEHQQKTYGEADPYLTYSVIGLVNDDKLEGKLDREAGNNVGHYKITVGTLKNDNYQISLTEAYLEILPRKVTVQIEFLNKVYDGTLDVNYVAEYFDSIQTENFNIHTENFKLILSAHLVSKNSGFEEVVIASKRVDGDNAFNYTFDYVFKDTKIEVSRKKANIYIDECSKNYGDVDPIFTLTTSNVVKGEELDIILTREAGENVGSYRIYLQDGYEAQNANYDISVVESRLQILQIELRISVGIQSKSFGSPDTELLFDLVDQLKLDDTKQSVFDGTIYREFGEKVGKYAYDISHISSSKNYRFINVEDSYFEIVKRKVKVQIADISKFYGDPDPIYKYYVLNAVAGENLFIKIERQEGEDIGKYTLTSDTIEDDRYIVEISNGSLTINPCEIRIKAEQKFKVYGEADPVLSIEIIDGFLKNNDVLENIVSGSLERKQGEDAGEYQISIGSLSLGKNYKVDYVSDVLIILQRHLVITAISDSKVYGEDDPELRYSIGGEGLAFSDTIQGKLSRQPGEDVYTYDILFDTLEISSNYDVEFVGGKFEIERRRIQIIPTTISKEYGDADSEIEYLISGSLIGDDKLQGRLYRDRGSGNGEDIGRYLIKCELFNSNYDIVLDETYFTIYPREVVIQADDCQATYGESDPEFTFTIKTGTILDGDELVGGLYINKRNSVGTYDILSTLSLGNNYNLIFIKGKFTITPAQLTLQSPSYTKIYGQDDPKFRYEIVSGTLYNNDILFGNIYREQGENVGEYELISSVYNSNYIISLLPAKLEILKRDVYMVGSVYDKVYDGTTSAYLKMPYVTGVIDDVYLEYDPDHCADFVSAEPGMNIAVTLHDITLGGENAKNYNLILPDDLYASIMFQTITNQDVSVVVDEPIIHDGSTLNYTSEGCEQNFNNYRFVIEYNIWLDNVTDDQVEEGTYTIKLRVSDEIYKKHNILVYQKNEKGEYVVVDSKKGDDGEIIITTSTLGSFYIAIENDSWMNYSLFIAVVAITLISIFALYVVVQKARNNPFKRKK